jgi:acetyl-CoA C-acetyltransferase
VNYGSYCECLQTPIGKYGGSLSQISPEEMAATLMNNNLSLSGYRPDIVDEVILGQTKQSAHTPNIARVASLIAGFPEEVTRTRYIGSAGMQGQQTPNYI